MISHYGKKVTQMDEQEVRGSEGAANDNTDDSSSDTDDNQRDESPREMPKVDNPPAEEAKIGKDMGIVSAQRPFPHAYAQGIWPANRHSSDLQQQQKPFLEAMAIMWHGA